MKKEKLKTLLLIFLIFSSVVLSARVWSGKELTGGYNFFASLGDGSLFSRFFNKGEYSMPIENLSKPQKIVVTAGENRSVYYNSDTLFDNLHQQTKTCLLGILGNELSVTRKAVVGEDEWYGVLRNDELLDTRSIYIDYSLSYTPTLFGQALGIENTWLRDPGEVREFILAPLEDGGTLFYVRDFLNNDIYKYYIDYDGAEALALTIKEYSSNDDAKNYSYAFELNLDAAAFSEGEQTVLQKVVLDPLVLVSPHKTKTVVITSKNPLKDEYRTDKLLELFDYNAAPINTYEDNEGVKYFVENYSSLKISPNGMVEYSAVEDSKGLNLFADSASRPTFYESLNKAVDFAESVWDAILPSASFDALVTSDLIEGSADSSYRFTLDYYVEGNPVSVMLSDNTRNAVEIVMKNGVITSYRHLIRQYERTETFKENLSMVEALDSIFASFSKREEQTQISDIFLSYVEDGSDKENKTLWCAKVLDEVIFIKE